MMNKFKLSAMYSIAGIIVMTVLIMFSIAACDIDGNGNGGSGSRVPEELWGRWELGTDGVGRMIYVEFSATQFRDLDWTEDEWVACRLIGRRIQFELEPNDWYNWSDGYEINNNGGVRTVTFTGDGRARYGAYTRVE